MKINKTRARRLVWAWLAGALALLFASGLSLLLSHFQALAQPALETAELSVEKTADKGAAAPGDTLTYTIMIREDGAGVTLWMTDVLPAEVTYVDSSLQFFGPGNPPSFAGGTITWSASNFGYGATAYITFSVQIDPETTAGQVENTVQVTGTGQLVTASEETAILTGQAPVSQIRSPDMDAVVTQKDSLPISGIAWREGTEPPYLVERPVLSLQRVDERTYYLIWTPVTSAEHYLVQEATRPDFSDQTPLPAVPAPTTNTIVSKGAGQDGTYYYRVQAFKLGMESSPWSNVQSVAIPWPAASVDLPASPLSTDLAVNEAVTVEVRVDRVGDTATGEWQAATVTSTVWGGWDWRYDWNLPQEDGVQYRVHTRASDAIGGVGAIDTVTVTLRNKGAVLYMPLFPKRWPPIPYPPTLNDIQSVGGTLTVSWVYGDHPDAPVDNYTLQEATDADFTANVVNYGPIAGTSYQVTGKAVGSFYYRVRGNNSYGSGGWSNVKSVSFGYFDDFSDAGSGWPVVKKKVIPVGPDNPYGSYYRLRYDDGQYRIMIDAGGPDIWFHQPDALAPYRPPSDKYCVETMARLVKGKDPYEDWGDNDYPYWANGGLVFGANEANTDIYVVCLSVGGGNTMGWFIAHNPEYDYPMKGCAYLDNPGIGEGAGALDIKEWHRIQVSVDGNWFTLYIDGKDKGTWRLGGLNDTTRVGLIGGDYEITPVDFRFDNFRVTPNASCTP